MNMLSVLSSLKPVISVSAWMPLLIAVILWLFFYFRYDMGRLKRIKKVFEALSDAGEKLDDCKRENISFLDNLTDMQAPSCLLEARLKMQLQLEKNFKGDFIPEGHTFYDFDTLITIPGCRGSLGSLWKSFWLLSIVTLISPPGIAFFLQPEAVFDALALGGILFVLLSLGNLIFTMLDQKLYFSTTTEYHRFIGVFNKVLPVAKAEVALLLEATERNREVYQAATDKITDKFDTIVEDTLLPALEDSIELIMSSYFIPAVKNIEETLNTNLNKTMELQKTGMERMTAAFADRLGDTVEAKMNGLAAMIGGLTESIGNTQSRMEELNTDLGQHIAGLSEAVSRNIEMQEEQTMNMLQLQSEKMTQAMELQEQAMERISSAFSESLFRTMDNQTSKLAVTINEVRSRMEEFNVRLGKHTIELIETTEKSIALQNEHTAVAIALQDERINHFIDLQTQQIAAFATDFRSLMGELNIKLSDNIESLSGMLADQHQLMEESAKVLTATGEAQERTIVEYRGILQKAVDNSEFLNLHIKTMTETVDKLTEQTMTFSKEAFTFTKETNEAQIRMSEGIKLSQGKLEAAVNETMSQYVKMNSMISDMMDNITERMNEAMTNAGREIAHGIKEVTADNAEAISNLTEQAQNLRSDYETYFSRLDTSTAKLLEDMDYQIKDIIMRITEDIGVMMKENITANAEILDRYKDNTTDLLQSFDEQARSIGLYAQEINMDIRELSESLHNSVDEFSKGIQDGVRVTLGEMDSGLSELTERIANTVESISDAVEALPEALSRR